MNINKLLTNFTAGKINKIEIWRTKRKYQWIWTVL